MNIFSELQDLKKQVVQSIKSNNELEEALNTMDIKIGLLVKNRITLQVRSSVNSFDPRFVSYKLVFGRS